MNASIGVNPITWSNDDLPQVGGEISLETCLAESLSFYHASPMGIWMPPSSARLATLYSIHSITTIFAAHWNWGENTR